MMATTFENFSASAFFPTRIAEAARTRYEEIYESNRHRVYALSFWMTDNELTAEELLERTFRHAFSLSDRPSSEALDSALIAELGKLMTLGTLTLKCGVCTKVASVRRNTLRVHLERAVVQLPPTERLVFLMHDVENYGHDRIGRHLGLSENQSKYALHQARFRVRELLAAMTS